MTPEQELLALRAKVNAETALILKDIKDMAGHLEKMRSEIFGEPVLHASEDFELESSGHIITK